MSDDDSPYAGYPNSIICIMGHQEATLLPERRSVQSTFWFVSIGTLLLQTQLVQILGKESTEFGFASYGTFHINPSAFENSLQKLNGKLIKGFL